MFFKYAANSNPSYLIEILRSGVDINVQNDIGETALLVAACHARKENVDILLKHGADPNIPTHEGLTALIAASEIPNNHRVIISLVQGGAIIDAIENTGKTALMVVCAGGLIKNVRVFTFRYI